MVDFPSTTFVNRLLPKDKFIEHLDLSPILKKKLGTDIVHIRVLNKFSNSVLNFNDLPETEKDSKEEIIKEVLLIRIELKKHDFDSKLIEAIAKQNSHKLVFLLRFEKYAKLALYYQRLYESKWKPFEDLSLVLIGKNMNEVWLSFIRQIANGDEVGVLTETITKNDLDNKLDIQNRLEALQKEITRLDSAIRKERQPRKKYELHQKLLELEESYQKLGDNNG